MPTRNTTSTATAPPATPSAGNGPQPKMSAGDSGISTTAPAQVTIGGHRHVAGAADHAASELNSQTRIAPAKIELE